MTDKLTERATLAETALRFCPPLLRNRLLQEKSFVEEYGIEAEGIISFGDEDVSFPRSELFSAIRSVLSGSPQVEISDRADCKWRLKNEATADGIPNLLLSSNGQSLLLPGYATLSSESAMRLRALDEVSVDVNLPPDAYKRWREILTERAFEDHEVHDFQLDLRNTPVWYGDHICSELVTGEFNVTSLVPNSHQYYERLVGLFDGSDSIGKYAAGIGQKLFEHLFNWNAYEGLQFSLLLSSHSSLTAEICIDKIDAEKLLRAFENSVTHGDTISRLGLIEVGCRILQDVPEIEPFLLRLVRCIRDDDIQCASSDIRTLSALFVFVDGELARTRLMAEASPFYRRLAALAQAGLIQRQIIQCGVDAALFTDSLRGLRAEYSYMQSLADMRTEPRWPPDFSIGVRLKAQFLGRIMNVGRTHIDRINSDKLREIIAGTGEQSIQRICEFPLPNFPGPLEGAEDSQNELPDEVSHEIQERLVAERIVVSSFIPLINSAIIFKIDWNHGQLAACALKRANHIFANLEDRYVLLDTLNGLASVAAISRNANLADDLRILVRRYLNDSTYGVSVEEAMRVGLVAAAARQELADWCVFVGEWMTELAFGELKGSDGETLHSHLITLLHAVPELWVSCSRAEAALDSYCSR